MNVEHYRERFVEDGCLLPTAYGPAKKKGFAIRSAPAVVAYFIPQVSDARREGGYKKWVSSELAM